MANHKRLLVRLEEIDEAVRCSDHRARPRDDRLEQLIRVAAVHQGDRRLVERREVRVLMTGRTVAAARRRLGEIQRLVGDRDELVLGQGIRGIAGDPDRCGHPWARPARQLSDIAADPLGNLVGLDPSGARQEDGELVAGRRSHRSGHPGEEGVAGRVAAGVVEGLERVEVEHEECETRGAGRGYGLAELALERAVVSEAGQRVVFCPDLDRAVGLGILEGDRRLAGEQLRQFELVPAERCVVAHPADVQRPDHLAGHQERDDDHRFRLEGRPRDLDRTRVEMRVIHHGRLAMLDDPARDSDSDRPGILEDDVGKPIPGDDGAPNADDRVAAIDRQRVVRNDRLERVGDHVEDALRVERREKALVDLEEAALARELVLQLELLAIEELEMLGVDDGLRGIAGEDRQRRLVVRAEHVAALRGDDDHAVGAILESHRDDQQ